MESKINTFEKGLYKDSTIINQPDGTYTFALNAVNESSNGEVTAIVNEEGNFDCLGISASSVIGSITLDDSVFVLFLKDNNSIILFDSKTCTQTLLLQDDCLNFQRQIQGVSRVIKGCERVIYFVDGVNPDRAINIDDILNNPSSHSYLDSSGNVDCELIRDRKNFIIPEYSRIDVNNNGGSLKLGSYQIILQYEDEDGFQTGFFGHTLEIPVTNGAGGYNEITGGDPLYFPVTSKSITFELSQLDSNYKYVKIFVAETVNHVTLYYNVDKLVISASTLTYTIDTLSEKPQVDGGQFNVDYSFYETSETIAQIDDRLLKANVKEKLIDYSLFQIEANLIKTRYVVKEVEASNPSDSSGSPKSSTYYLDNKSYMRDEIYSLGIVWVFKNGLRTPVMHIPGRVKDTPSGAIVFPATDTNTHTRPSNTSSATWDSELIVAGTHNGLGITSQLEDYKHLYNEEFDLTTPIILQVERWRAYNTAFRTNFMGISGAGFPANPYYSKGELAYWESEYRYPVVQNCQGDYVYPVDESDPNNVVGQFIRHHKMPDTTLEPHFESNKILPLGLELSNINIPAGIDANDIQGYLIVRQKREGINKTIIDKGIIYNNTYIVAKNQDNSVPKKTYNLQTDWFGASRLREDGSPYFGLIPEFSSLDTACGRTDIYQLTNTYPGNDARNYINYSKRSLSFHGVLNKFNKNSTQATHYKHERELRGTASMLRETSVTCDEDDKFKEIFYSGHYTTSALTNFTNRAIESPLLYITPDKEFPESILKNHFINKNQQETLVFESVDDVTNPQEGSGPQVYDDNRPLMVNYGSIKNHKTDIYGQLNNNQYQAVDSNLTAGTQTSLTVFGGDCFINRFYFFKSSMTKTCLKGKDCSWGVNDETRRRVVQKQLISYFVESEINSDLRHIDYNNLSDLRNTFYPYYNGSETKFLRLDIPANNDFTPWEEGTYMKNLYLYNTDYNKETEVKSYFHLDSGFDYCSDCIVEHPTRIAYSEKGGESDSIDNYRVFLANNFRDLPSNTGEITNLFVNFNELYAHTRYTMYKVFTKPHELRSDQSTLYVGVGGFFSVPSQELVSTDYGYGGSGGKFGTKTTEFGTVFVDDLTGKVFLFTDNLNEISSRMGDNNTGMRNWFEENIPLTLNQQWLELTGEDYPYVHQPALEYGIGFLTYYDPRHKRIIITKKDYEIINPSTFVVPTNYTGGSKGQMRLKILQSNVAVDLNLIFKSGGSINYTTFVGHTAAQSAREMAQLLNSAFIRYNIPLYSYYVGDEIFVETTQNTDFYNGNFEDFRITVLTSEGYFDDNSAQAGIAYNFFPHYTAYTFPMVGTGAGVNGGAAATLDFSNTSLYRNKSWTVSFSLLSFNWVSFHSYLPNYAFNNANNFFTTKIDSNFIWKHDKHNYQTYYGQKKDFIIEYTQKENPVVSKVYDKISYISKCELYDAQEREYRDIYNKTFTHLLAYNSYQTTGKLAIELKDDPFEMLASANGILAYEKENMWNINDFRDYCINRNVPLNSSSWTNIQGDYFIDKVPNPVAYSPNKSVFDLEVMRDLYLNTRLYFNDSADIKFTLNGVLTDQKVSFR